MAIDTTEKKLSLMTFGDPTPETLPFADGSLDVGDKQHFLNLYSGITAGAPGGVTLMAMERSKFRRVFGRIFGRVN